MAVKLPRLSNAAPITMPGAQGSQPSGNASHYLTGYWNALCDAIEGALNTLQTQQTAITAAQTSADKAASMAGAAQDTANIALYVPAATSVAVESFGVTRTIAATVLDFTTGIGVTDGGSGNETIFTYWPDIKDYGAVGDGTTDDTAAFVLAAAAGLTIVISPGTYKLTGNVTFPNNVIFLVAASIVSSAAITVAFTGGVQAPLAKIFALTGSAAVTFNPDTQAKVYAEWWGATPYASSAYPVTSPTYSDTQIQAAINCGAAVLELQGADYYIANALNLLNNYFTLQGVGYWVSRLVIKSASIDGVVIGPASQPGSTANYVNYVNVRNLVVQRTVAATSLSGNVTGSPSGIRARWTANLNIDHVFSVDHSNDFLTTGTLSTHYERCYALRTIATNGSGWDFFNGFAQDNSPVISGIVSGNASLYYGTNAVLNVAGAFSGSTFGLTIYGGYSDTFVHALETSQCAAGILAAGTGTTGTAMVNEDLKITNCVLDGCSTAALRVTNSNEVAQVLIADNYLSCSATCLQIDKFTGLASVTGNQMTAFGSGVTGIYLYANGASCSGVSCYNNIITDCTLGEKLDGASECRIVDSVNNVNYSATAAVYMTGSASYCIVTPIVTGSASGKSGIGVKIDSGVSYSTIDPSGINPASLTSASASNKVVYNGTQVTAPGLFGSNDIVVGWIAAPAAPGTVTSVSSANTDLTVATGTTTPVLTVNSAPKLDTGRTIAITGDLAYTSPSFDGSANVTAAGTLATVNPNVGSFTNASITVNGKGLITAAASGAASGNSWLPVVSGAEPPAFITDGAGALITVAYTP